MYLKVQYTCKSFVVLRTVHYNIRHVILVHSGAKYDLCMYVCMYECMYICMNVCMYVRTCMYMCAYVRMGIYTSTDLRSPDQRTLIIYYN